MESLQELRVSVAVPQEAETVSDGELSDSSEVSSITSDDELAQST